MGCCRADIYTLPYLTVVGQARNLTFRIMTFCQQLLSTGVCSDNSCTQNHDVRVCEPCGLILTSDNAYNSQISTARHAKRASGGYLYYDCPICRRLVIGLGWDEHVKGRRHQHEASQQGVSPDIAATETVVPPGCTICELCKASIPTSDWNAHKSSQSHRRAEKFHAYNTVYDQAAKNKQSVTISLQSGLDFGIVEVSDARAGVSKTLAVTMAAQTQGKELVASRWLSSISSIHIQPSCVSISVEGD
jgi:helicase MOV-10